jgi:RNA polymerase-binding transcription factor DksA
MATKTKTASKTAKKAAPTKKAAPVKKTVATKKAAPAPAKKAALKSKPAAKKTAAPAKKSAPAKVAKKAAAPVKPAAKKAAPKKAIPQKVAKAKPAPAKKAAAKPVANKAKATSAKTAPTKAPAKKALPAKPTVKKNIAPAKPAAKPSAPKAVTKAAPVVKKEVVMEKPIKKSVPEKEKKAAKPAPAKRKVNHNVITAVPSARSEIVDAVRQLPRKTTPKPGVVIAHRKIEKKVTEEEPGLTMKEYNPTVRSLLDEPEQSSGPVYRYSDEELNEFKELITKRLDSARKELGYLQGLITRKDETGTDDTDNRFNHMEDGSGAMEREQLSQLAGRQIQFINHLEKAMMRIENKTYGICRVTGKLIDKARLRAVPHATLSIEAKKVMNK